MYDKAREILDQAEHIEVFTGAGMSADSGLATYRDAVTGIWENVDPQAMASIDAWGDDPETMFAWYLWRAHLAQQAEPNAGHIAIAEAAKRKRVTVTTQNIDNLHERAGSGNVVHLHGSLFEFRCSLCDAPFDTPIDIPTQQVSAITPPECPRCGGFIRPGVVWFGEALPQDAFKEAERRMTSADAVIIVGTSGVVFPAAGLPMMAHAREIPIIEVTPMRTDLSHLADVVLEATAAEALPEILHG